MAGWHKGVRARWRPSLKTKNCLHLKVMFTQLNKSGLLTTLISSRLLCGSSAISYILSVDACCPCAAPRCPFSIARRCETVSAAAASAASLAA